MPIAVRRTVAFNDRWDHTRDQYPQPSMWLPLAFVLNYYFGGSMRALNHAVSWGVCELSGALLVRWLPKVVVCPTGANAEDMQALGICILPYKDHPEGSNANFIPKKFFLEIRTFSFFIFEFFDPKMCAKFAFVCIL